MYILCFETHIATKYSICLYQVDKENVNLNNINEINIISQLNHSIKTLSMTFQNNPPDKSENIAYHIAELLAKQNLNIHDIEYIICCNGPGSFTGIRIALTTLFGYHISNLKIHSFNIPYLDIVSYKIISDYYLNFYQQNICPYSSHYININSPFVQADNPPISETKYHNICTIVKANNNEYYIQKNNLNYDQKDWIKNITVDQKTNSRSINKNIYDGICSDNIEENKNDNNYSNNNNQSGNIILGNISLKHSTQIIEKISNISSSIIYIENPCDNLLDLLKKSNLNKQHKIIIYTEPIYSYNYLSLILLYNYILTNNKDNIYSNITPLYFKKTRINNNKLHKKNNN